jgi:hypothetical protein
MFYFSNYTDEFPEAIDMVERDEIIRYKLNM